jgi:putative sugar O-methyltransferase
MEQLDDDINLLNDILADADRSSTDFSATSESRWSSYSDTTLVHLREHGLVHFRKPGVLPNHFGATDKNPDPKRASAEDLFHSARSTFCGPSARRLEELPASKVGSPEGFTVENSFYTLSWLNYFCRYAFVSNFINFDSQIIVEVGPGCGKQAEMLKRAHPNLTLLLFDLPTQIYITDRYLSKVLGPTGDVANYRECRNVNNFKDIKLGKINIFPHWKFSIVNDCEFDLLWNAASFQEMAAPTSCRYLSGCHNAKALYIMHNIKYRGTKFFPGYRGSIDATNIPAHYEHYRQSAHLALVPPTWLYCDSFWKRRSQSG